LLLPQPKGNDDGRQQAPGCGPGALRFAAHFALALRATGVLAEPSWEEDQYDPLQVRPQQLFCFYRVLMGVLMTSLSPYSG